MLDTLKRLVTLLPPATRGRWALLVPLVLLTAVFEAAGAAAIFGLIRILNDPARATALPIAGALLRELPPLDAHAVTIFFALLVGLFYAVKNGLTATKAWAQARCVNESAAATSEALVRGYLRAPWGFHLRRNSAELIHSAHTAVQQVYATAAAAVLGVLTEGFVALGIVAVLLVAAPGVTLVAITVLLALSLALLRLTRGATTRLGERLDHLRRTALLDLQEALGAVKELKVLGREHALADRYAADRHALARVGWRYGTIAALPRLVVEMVFVCGALIVVVLLGASGRTGAETVPLLGLYAYAGFRVIPSANRILWLVGEIRFAGPAVERVYRDLAVLPREAPATLGALAFRDLLALEGVSYAHQGSSHPVLQEVNLAIHRGEVVGIIGPTGAGKSTLIDIVVGLLEPTTGRVTVDGVDLRACSRAWQREIGYVPQTVFLLDDTLRRNIALGVPDAEIDETLLRAAIRRAQLERFVTALPSGLETVVGEHGVRLSGGERQRIGVARALYHEPGFLVFDEATSALDGRTEAALIEALDANRGEFTMLIVAHRLASVRHCDRLVLLRDGRIADSGTFEELVARHSELGALTDTSDSR